MRARWPQSKKKALKVSFQGLQLKRKLEELALGDAYAGNHIVRWSTGTDLSEQRVGKSHKAVVM